MIGSLRQYFGRVYELYQLTGLWRFLLASLFRLVTSPIIWERFLVRKITGRRLAKELTDLGNYRCDELVSVVLPVNNGRSKGVERLVASLKAQTHRKIEFIAVDSGSTDDTVAWLKSEQFTVIEIPPQSFTHAFSRNTGAAVAKGKFLLFVVDDVVFNNPDWLRSALYLLERFDADSISTRQTIDDRADAYARCLDTFLSVAQSDRLSVNVSRRGPLRRWLTRVLPLYAMFRSVAIDDTNHLVRRDSFERIRFHAPTVEDIDFALRLAAAGGRVIYTNLLSVLHYHTHNLNTLSKYARRVYVDSRVITRWEPYILRYPSREAFLLAGLHSLVIFLQAIREVDKEDKSLIGYRKKYDDADSVDVGYVDSILELSVRLDSSEFRALRYINYPSFDEARRIFVQILGAEPPADLYYNRVVNAHFVRKMRDDMMAARGALFPHHRQIRRRDDVKTVVMFLWVYRIMSHIARPEIFVTAEIAYPCDCWDIGTWA